MPAHRRPSPAWLALLAHTGRSAVFHTGWLAQAQLGQALSWSWFGGLGGVALWWLLVAIASGRPQPRRAAHPAARLLLAALATAGLALAMHQGTRPAGLAGWALQLVAWAALCSQLTGPARTPQPPGPGARLHCRLGSALGMLLAATLAAQSLAWMERWPLAAALLLATALLPVGGGRHALHRLDVPMGLMMGSLLPMAQWCASQGWNASTVVALHLAAMAAGVAAGALLRPGPFSGRLAWASAAALCLLPPASAMLAAAGLLAWASDRPGPGQARTAAWTGSLLLLLVGEWGSTWGPDALRLVLVPVLLMAALWPQGGRKAAWA